ncbi:MAG: ferredoxin [Hoeflea sp.]|uniref:ferredoxin n=1 Tax=Hoeflea sp. TaxID=1940281 RepID=UPI0032989392
MSRGSGLAVLDAALAKHGLCRRGRLVAGDAAVAMPSNGGAVSFICLVGHAGGGFWPVFEAWRKAHRDVEDPLDRWSEAVIRPLAEAAGGEAVFPSDRPWHPFQQWAMLAEGLKPSPLGMLIHPEYGLWHGYRGAILFGPEARVRLLDPTVAASQDGESDVSLIHPCDACPDRPCMTVCPVKAFGPAGFTVDACRTHLKTDDGRQGCMSSGCLARDACPVGREHRYSGAQVGFHMAGFG